MLQQEQCKYFRTMIKILIFDSGKATRKRLNEIAVKANIEKIDTSLNLCFQKNTSVE